MGALGGLTGLAGGASGTGFAKPAAADIQTPVSTDQTNQSYAQNQAALAQQQGLVTALQGQNGIGNQSQVYNQLQGVVNGTGPNPAQAQLAQATQGNVANQAALMAGQRGAGSNVGLIARQAAMQGANTQQQAAGQAATMQANQSLNALNSAGTIAGQQVSNQVGATTANTQANQSEQQNLLNAIAASNNAKVGSQSNINSTNGALAGTEMNNQAKLIGGAGNAAGVMAGGARGGVVNSYADGGSVNGPQSAFGQFLSGWSGGNANAPAAPNVAAAPSILGGDWQLAKKTPAAKPQTPAPNGALGGDMGGTAGVVSADDKSAGQFAGAGTPAVGGTMTMAGDAGSMPGMVAAKGGKVPALVSPGEKYLSPKAVQQVKAGKANPMEVGETIPGKPKVGGAKNDYANDTVPKTLDEGGIVLPRSVTQSKNPQWEAHKFVSKLMAEGGLVRGKRK